MSYTVTAKQQSIFQQDGVVKLDSAIDSTLLAELNACFEWAVEHPGPILFGNAEGDEFSFVDYDNPQNRSRYEKAIANSPFGQIAAGLWQSEFVGFLCEEVFWKKGKANTTYWHQDTSYLPWGGPHWANFWIPLVPHTAEYAIQVVRGSHTGTLYDGTTFASVDPTEPLW